MSVTWTEEQKQVIELRDRNLLVSAAAGSGKTAVLVERIITRLTKDNPPIDVDQLLVVTFTEAAAAEMKERIGAALEKALEANPESAHLKKQAALIHTAKIMTIHSFCLSVIREYFHTIQLDPGFRVAEEGELKLLKRDVLQELLEEKYEEGTPEFLEFVESFATGRDDVKLEDMILKLYEYAGSYPDADSWLDNCVKQYQLGVNEDAAFVKKIVEYVRNCVSAIQSDMELAVEIALSGDGPSVYEKTILEDEALMEAVFEANSFEEFHHAFQKIDKWTRLATNRDKSVSEEKIIAVKALRESWKKTVNDMREEFFSIPLADLDADMKFCYPVVQTLASLVKDFGSKFLARKVEKNIIDFHDMEQYALQILTKKENGIFVPTEAAKDYQKQFVEIMIDEYQDSNFLQETILTSVSRTGAGKYNIFMVGDVKQSIYRFRLSRPELFMDKYNTYHSENYHCQKIDLHKNFRSRAEVLDSVNSIFRQIMTEKIGGITYDENAALYVGATYPEASDKNAELLLIGTKSIEDEALKSEEARELEVRAIADKIKDLMKIQMVWDKKSESMRPVKYSDIVILSRSLKGYAEDVIKILTEEGIPVIAESQEGYFETLEIRWILDYLRVLDNYRQDIPLTSVLKSPFGNCSNEELAQVREAWGNVPFHEAVLRTAGIWWDQEMDMDFEMDIQVKEKIQNVFDSLEQFRKRVSYTSIHELLWNIVKETGYRDYISAMPGGEQRVANLDMLLMKAKTYENTSYKGLFHFVRYMDQVKKYELEMGEVSLSDEQTNAVRLMSIHKSKGLEFPVVIVAGLGKRFNTQDLKGELILHPDMGVGMDAIDVENRTKVQTLLKAGMKKQTHLENLGEELRVLYVALTRAKEKLIMVGTCTEPEEKLEKQGAITFTSLSNASTYLDWILSAYINEPKPCIDLQVLHVENVAASEIFHDVEAVAEKKAYFNLVESEASESLFAKRITEQFAYEYPYKNEQVKMKFSVSELKKRAMFPEEREETSEHLIQEEVAYVPEFIEKTEELTGASRGSAYHKVMELLDFTKEYTKDSLIEQMIEWEKEGYLSEQMRVCIEPEDILKFLESSVGKRMHQAAVRGKLFKERPFVMGVDAKEVYPDIETEEMVLIQGIIDVYFEEEDKIIVLDYKTDKVWSAKELIQRYQEQLHLYSKALTNVLEKTVEEKIIYSFTLKKEINL